MVTAFLNFARPQPLELADVTLSELVKDCALELKTIFDEHGVTLTVEGDFPQIRADERMLRQALLNLLRNRCRSSADIAAPVHRH